MEEDSVIFVHTIQVVPVGCGVAPRLRTPVFEKGIASMTDVVVFGAVGQIPHQNGFERWLRSVVVSEIETSKTKFYKLPAAKFSHKN